LPFDVAAAVNAASARSQALRFDVHWYPSVTSTMDLASEAAQVGASEGWVVLADEQTAGRGRRGRHWSSPPGAGLYLSFVLRPALQAMRPSLVSLLTLAAGVAVRDAITRASGLTPDLKWPNDVMVNQRKLAGILAEGVSIGTSLQTVILGIGINVSRGSHPSVLAERATSLEAEMSQPPDRVALLQEVLVMMATRYDQLRSGRPDQVLDAWRAAAPRCHGASIEWDSPQGVRHGLSAGVDHDGALLVTTSQGTERIIAGEVRWL
jgi:BirA family biotin operon repressor/biotin-[acetyl-CoA-carboxylase] ligase